MKTNRLMSAETYLMTASTKRLETDDQPTALGQRILDRQAARQAAKAAAGYQAGAAGIAAQRLEVSA